MEETSHATIYELLESVGTEETKKLLKQKTKLDPKVKIRMRKIKEEKGIGVWIAEIPESVAPHVHRTEEYYKVIEGIGNLFTGNANFANRELTGYQWEKQPKQVSEGDSFWIKGSQLHMLSNLNSEDEKRPLKILFSGPVEHLSTDRFIVDSPKQNG